ncbi:hypothetical protein PCE1_002624 [Barthelona sp. PCE]
MPFRLFAPFLLVLSLIACAKGLDACYEHHLALSSGANVVSDLEDCVLTVVCKEGVKDIELLLENSRITLQIEQEEHSFISKFSIDHSNVTFVAVLNTPNLIVANSTLNKLILNSDVSANVELESSILNDVVTEGPTISLFSIRNCTIIERLYIHSSTEIFVKGLDNSANFPLRLGCDECNLRNLSSHFLTLVTASSTITDSVILKVSLFVTSGLSDNSRIVIQNSVIYDLDMKKKDVQVSNLQLIITSEIYYISLHDLSFTSVILFDTEISREKYIFYMFSTTIDGFQWSDTYFDVDIEMKYLDDVSSIKKMLFKNVTFDGVGTLFPKTKDSFKFENVTVLDMSVGSSLFSTPLFYIDNLVLKRSSWPYEAKATIIRNSIFEDLVIESVVYVRELTDVMFNNVVLKASTSMIGVESSFEARNCVFSNISSFERIFTVLSAGNVVIDVSHLTFNNITALSIFGIDSNSASSIRMSHITLNTVEAMYFVKEETNRCDYFYAREFNLFNTTFNTVFDLSSVERGVENKEIGIYSIASEKERFKLLVNIFSNWKVNLRLENLTLSLRDESHVLVTKTGYRSSLYIVNSSIVLGKMSTFVILGTVEIEHNCEITNVTIDAPHVEEGFPKAAIYGFDFNMRYINYEVTGRRTRANTKLGSFYSGVAPINSIFDSKFVLYIKHDYKQDLFYYTVSPFKLKRIPSDYIIEEAEGEEYKSMIGAINDDIEIPQSRAYLKACMKGYYFSEYECKTCSVGYHVNDDQTRCVVDEPQRIDFDRAHPDLFPPLYHVPPGYFVVDDTPRRYLIDCFSSFCEGGRVRAGLMGKTNRDISFEESIVYSLNGFDLSKKKSPGCTVGHYGVGCARCLDVADIFTYGCITFPVDSDMGDYRTATAFIFIVHCTLLVLLFRYKNIFLKIPWTKLLGDDNNINLLDVEVGNILIMIRDFLFIVWPILFSSSVDTDLRNVSDSSVYARLVFNPLLNINVLFGEDQRLFFVQAYPLVLLMCFWKWSYKLLYVFIAYIVDTELRGMVSAAQVWLFRALILSIFLIEVLIKKKPKWLVAVMFPVLSIWVHPFILHSGQPSLYIVFPVVLWGSMFDKPSNSNILTINYFLLPYVTTGLLLYGIPIPFKSIYGENWGQGFHSLMRYEQFHPIMFVVFVFYIAFYIFCFWFSGKQKQKDMQFYSRMFFLIAMVGRSVFTFISFISHYFLANQLYLLVLMLYIKNFKPFHRLNNQMLQFMYLFFYISIVSLLYKKITFLEFFVVFSSSLVVVIKCMLFRKSKNKVDATELEQLLIL